MASNDRHTQVTRSRPARAARRGWGPEHQHAALGAKRGGWVRWLVIGGVVAYVLWAWGLSHPGFDPVQTVVKFAAIGGALLLLGWILRGGQGAQSQTQQRASLATELALAPDPLGAVREYARAMGGGAFLGFSRDSWVSADPEHAVLVLGPPRSGKTSRLVVPAILACPGALVSTSTKPDVIAATIAARRTLGETWLFDPSGEHDAAQLGARALSWSPVAAAVSWDGALLMARAMTLAAPAVGRGTQHEQHWAERAAALLAPLLFAANRSGQPIAGVLRWVLRQELDEPGRILEGEGAQVAVDVLLGIARTDERERSSIFSATAGVLALYNTDSARSAAERPNFDADVFAAGTDTVFITAPAHRQALCAPLVVGLLEQIRHATYRRAATVVGGLPLFFCLDEVANIAPIHDLPAMVSEAGGQGLHVMACLQDLSQARARWGDHAADGFLSLFQTKLVLPGVSDPKTLEAISVVLGEYDRQLVSRSIGVSEANSGWLTPTTTTVSDSVTYSTARQRTLGPGEIAAIPHGHGLLVRGARWGLLQTTPFYDADPWRQVTRNARLALLDRNMIDGQATEDGGVAGPAGSRYLSRKGRHARPPGAGVVTREGRT